MPRRMKAEKPDKPEEGATQTTSNRKSCNTDHLNGLIAANLIDSTDFKIELGIHSWRVHSKIISAKSRYFEVACSGSFKESQDRVVKLSDEDPWSIARLVQFVYTDEFEFDPKQESPLPIALLDLVRKGTFPSEEDIEVQSSTPLIDLCNDMWDIAEKYNVPDMERYLANLLVCKIEAHCNEAEKKAEHLKDLSEHLSQVFDMVGINLTRMPDIEDRIVDLLLYHIPCHRDAMGQGDLLLGLEAPSGHPTSKPAWQSEDIECLHKILRPYMNQNATFATKIATGLEHMLMKAYYVGPWSKTRIWSVSHKLSE